MREPGFYWVNNETLGWIVCEYKSFEVWIVPGSVLGFEDADFIEIDERRIERQPEVIENKISDVTDKIQN